MISVLFIFNSKGDVLMSKMFKEGVKRNVSDVFRIQVINAAARAPSGTTSTQARDVRLPVLTLGSTSFLYIRSGSLWFVAVTRSNQDSLVILEFLFTWISLLKQLTKSGTLSEENIVANFSTIYEMLDEMLEFGYPTNMDPSHLTSVVPGLSGVRFDNDAGSHSKSGKTSADTKATNTQMDHSDDAHVVSWREPGIKYRRNEIFLNVDEKIHVLMDAKGESLRSYIDGAITMKTHLSGMPVCRFGFSDNKYHNDLGTTLDDFKFHNCVDLPKYDSEQVIRFVPPDGTFQLMTYHVASSFNLPFRVVPQITELDDKLMFKIRLRSTYGPKMAATGVLLRIPTPNGVTKNSISCSNGNAKFNPEENVVNWRFNKFYGDLEQVLTVDLDFPLNGFNLPDQPGHNLAWAKPPITLDFTMEMFNASGFAVKFLKVVEKSNYRTIKWVKYTTQSGSYDIRL